MNRVKSYNALSMMTAPKRLSWYYYYCLHLQSRPSDLLIISSLRTSPSWLTVVRPSRIAHAAVQLPTVEVVAGWVERLCGREERTQFITWLMQSYRHVTINRVTACCTTRSVELVNISTNVYCISVSLQLERS